MLGKWERERDGQETPREAKLPGTCLFVDDKNHQERERERERERTHLARSRWMDWEMFCVTAAIGSCETGA